MGSAMVPRRCAPSASRSLRRGGCARSARVPAYRLAPVVACECPLDGRPWRAPSCLPARWPSGHPRPDAPGRRRAPMVGPMVRRGVVAATVALLSLSAWSPAIAQDDQGGTLSIAWESDIQYLDP